jgi:hypothetical protein
MTDIRQIPASPQHLAGKPAVRSGPRGNRAWSLVHSLLLP